MNVSQNAAGITESVQKQIQAWHGQGKHPAEIAKLLKKRSPVFSNLDERIVRRYIDFPGNSKEFVTRKNGLEIKVTPTQKLVGLMEKYRHTHGPKGIAFELGIPHELAKAFLDGSLNEQKIEELKIPLGIRRQIGKLNFIIEKSGKIQERTPEMEKFIRNLENKRQKLLDQAAQAKKHGD